MPLYGYSCKTCGRDFDRLLPLSRYNEEQICHQCGQIATKQMALGGIRDDHPIWLDNSIKSQLYDTDSPHIPIETRTDYNNFLKDNGIVPTN
jgi:putative FmdB family regulatory protein